MLAISPFHACAAWFCLFLCSGIAVCAKETVSFNQQVRPLLVSHCLPCHGGVKQKAGLSLVTREQAMAPTASGFSVIQPGTPDRSYLIERVEDSNDDSRMPPPEHGRRLSEDEVQILKQWIADGAQWELPWAYVPPQIRNPPVSVREAAWPRSKVDRFVLARMQAEGLSPAKQADRAQWLRRVSFDLIGLPPTQEQREDFQKDQRADAYERVVDRLLASPHFGERWASLWLDLSRYADTMGYERDLPRDIWPWRDWVVRAFNQDLPYNEFLLRQTAGDRLPDASLEHRLATAFHRNTPTNVEGGTDDEEFRWSAVVDRVDSTWQGLLGTSMACARCHDHPYDPLTQTDYYRFAAFFNNTSDADLAEDWPKLQVPEEPSRWPEMQKLDDELRNLRDRIKVLGRTAADQGGRWQPLAIDQAQSTGETKLTIRQSESGTEVFASGTLSDRSIYTLSAPSQPGPITAIRLDAQLMDPEQARAVSEPGFVLSRFRLFVEPTSAEEAEEPISEEVFFVDVLASDEHGFLRPIESLRDSPGGWGAYTRMREPCWAIFLPFEPIELPPGARLRLEFKHAKTTDGQSSLVLRRFAVATSSDKRLAKLANNRELQNLREREEQILRARAAIASTAVPVLENLPATRSRATYRLDGGNWLAPTERVMPGLPTVMPGQATDRLQLGRWLSSPENPLTARVIVNRVWAELFQVGLVAELDDFGTAGRFASHPELLDDLAARFQGAMGWSLKSVLRELVLSATYRQDSRTAHEQVQRDPNNRLLARGPRARLTAEMIRDQALLLSGRFNPALGGPPVMPYQPEGIWRTVFNNQRWEMAQGSDRYRRALYTYWKRTAAYPSMALFDTPSREQCTAERGRTNTPLQALVTLNDPAFVELAEGFAERMFQQTNLNLVERIHWAVREATTGDPLDSTVDELVQLYHELKERQKEDRFAYFLIANVILNLDATLTK